MTGHVDRVRNAANALLAGNAERDRWQTSLRRQPETAPLAEIVNSPPSVLPSSHELAIRAGVGERTLRNHVKEALGLTPNEIFASLKLERAVQRLADPDESVSAIAAQDFATAAAFDHFFGRYFGCSPSAFRRDLPAWRRRRSARPP